LTRRKSRESAQLSAAKTASGRIIAVKKSLVVFKYSPPQIIR
jgi:hypothetical protein